MSEIVDENMNEIKNSNCPEVVFIWEETKYNWFEKLFGLKNKEIK